MSELANIFGIDPTQRGPAPQHQVGQGREDWAHIEEEPERTADETYELEQRYTKAVVRNQKLGKHPRRF